MDLKDRTSRKRFGSILLLLSAIVGLAYACHWYAQWWDRVEYLRWAAGRQQAIKALGEQILAYAEQHEGRLPQSIGELVESGLLDQPESSSEGQWRSVKITRSLRSVPSSDLPEDLILLIERYDPPGDGSMVLYLSGRAVLVRDLAKLIAKDNMLRRECKLPTIP